MLSGAITSPSTRGVAVAVDTTIPLSRSYSIAPHLEGEPFTGELSLRANDGRSLAVTARDTRTRELFVDRRYTDGDGAVRETQSVPFAELSLYGPGGRPPFTR